MRSSTLLLVRIATAQCSTLKHHATSCNNGALKHSVAGTQQCLWALLQHAATPVCSSTMLRVRSNARGHCNVTLHCSIAHICVSTYVAQVHVKTYKMFMYNHRAKHRVGGARARARYRRRAAYVRLAVVVRRTVDGANDAQQHSARLAAD